MRGPTSPWTGTSFSHKTVSGQHGSLRVPHIPTSAAYFPRPLVGWESDEMNFVLEETARPYNRPRPVTHIVSFGQESGAQDIGQLVLNKELWPQLKGECPMSKKSTFNASSVSFGFYGGFFKDVSQELGLDKAVALHANQGKQTGAALAGMLKNELGSKKLNLAAFESVYAKFIEQIGITPDFKKKRSSLTLTVGHCPIYEGCRSAGLDHKTIELMCSQMTALENAELKKAYPMLSGCLKFRSTPDEPCVEEFVLLK